MARKNVIQFSVEVIDKVSTKLSSISGQITKFAKQAAVAAAGMATAFALAAKKAIGMADAIGKTAKVVGVSAEALQEFRFAAGQMGVSAIGIDDSLRRMQRRMGEFINSGAGPAQRAIEALGITITNANGQFIGTEEAFYRVTDAMARLSTTAEKSAVAAQLFGDDFGPKLVGLLEAGRKGIGELRDEARQLGLVIDNEAIAASEKAQDAFGRLATLMQTKFIKAFADNAEAIENTITLFLELTIEIFRVIDAFAKLTGLSDKGIKDLEVDIANLRDMQNELVKNLGDEAQFTPGYIAAEKQIQKNIAAISKLIEVQDMANSAAAISSGATTSGKRPATQLYALEKPGHLVQRYKELADWIQQNEMSMVPEKLIDSLDVLDEETKKVRDASRELGLTFTSAFEDAIVEGENLRSVLAGLLQDLLRIGVRKLFTDPLTDFFGGVFESIAGRASGGPVSAGTPYIVGERGPELFIPGASGRIASNSALTAGSGGMQFVTKIDARGADPGLIARLPQIMEQRDRKLMLKVKQYLDTGAVTL